MSNLKITCLGMVALGFTDFLLGGLIVYTNPNAAWLALGIVKIILGLAWWVVAYLIYEKYNSES